MRTPAPYVSSEFLNDSVIAVNPLHHPSPRLVAAASRAGALGVLELPEDTVQGTAEALDRTAQWCARPFGVRVRPGVTLTDDQLPTQARTVLLADPDRSPREFPGRRVLVEVTSPEEATRAHQDGASGLLVRGGECGGRAGELSTFVLLQRLLGDPDLDLPLWAWGGIGPRTAAAAVLGGAAGVVIDVQLALLDEADPTPETTEALANLDGSETVLVDGVRLLRRRGPQAPEPPTDRAAAYRAFAHEDPAQRLLPVGQDGYLAAALAKRWSTVRQLVRGLRHAIHEELGDGTSDSTSSAPTAALTEHSAGARSLGARLPIAQGPMTRVSDEPSFAAAVSQQGGLPFLALALSDAERTRTMLERTRDSLPEGASWGVGVLGFAEERIKEAQLAVIRELKPTHAIIAGGRPAQAAALEAEGISTFLHVPSPGLLRQFLAAGARKFIFEGAECGGHIGPRNSFPLWEAQTQVLLDFLAETPSAAPELTVLFAGGLHDARSAAMAATVAAPLTRAGAGFGVLMGTAYLFTEEAVSNGAITPLFQRQVQTAERTDLLETAPGHATRCAASAVTDHFATLRQALADQGVPEREIWEKLERFNVGRLRLASKGLERVGAEIRQVDEERQADEGMFMAGEVLVMRSETTTVAELHRHVTEGADQWWRQRAAALRPAEPAEEPAPEPLRVAVVGMSAMFPGAADLEEFWANILAGKDNVTEVSPDRWDPELYYDPEGDGVHTPSRWGGFLPRIPFDPLSYGIPPASLPSIEPVQLLALEAARRALVDAGYDGPEADHRRTSVIFGAEAGSDLSNATTLRTVLPAYTGTLPPALDEQLPRLTEDSFPGMLANVIAGRVANRLDLGGANYTVDAACASSLTAVDAACKELATGTSDLVLCGGADLHNGINDYLLFSSVHALSPTGRSATFDSEADGIALGEGVACVALKRLEDAERDGDRVYAVIDGVGSASDGRALGLTAPRPEGQRAAVTRAYRNARVSPREVGLVEAHGTGTVVGDRTELGTLSEVFRDSGAEAGGCAIGSVKSQIGHTKCAAGLAGLIKTTLALYHGVKPPTLHLKDPNPAWSADESPFAFHTTATPWATEPTERVAGVSAFGFGGTNFHVVLRAHEQAPRPHAVDAWPAELFTFRGRDDASAHKAVHALLKLAQDDHPWRLRDLARHASWRSDQAALRGEPVRVAVVASDLEQLPALLTRAAEGEHAPADGIHAAHAVEEEVREGQLAFLYPGQGSQEPGMFAELLVAFPELHRHLHLGARWADALFPPAAFDEEGKQRQRERITDTAVAQPALGITALVATDLLAGLGVRPAMAGGHSYGELAALASAGVLTAEELLEASAARAQAILGRIPDGPDSDPGTMAAVNTSADRVEEVLRLAGLDGDVVAANHNSPKQTVISGASEAVRTAIGRLKDAGHSAKPLPVACAFHSPLLDGAGDDFGQHLEKLPLSRPRFPVWANRTAEPYSGEAADIRQELSRQIGAPVRFAEQIEAMYEAGARVFVEAGPGKVLSRLAGTVLKGRPHRVVPLQEGRQKGLPGLLNALAQLAVSGVDVRTRRLFTGRDAVDPATVDKPRRPGWTLDGHLLRRADGTQPPHALRPARPVTEFTVLDQHPQPQPNGSEALIAEFLRASRDMVAAQRDVLMSYLGVSELPASPAPVRGAVSTPAATGAATPALPQAPAPAQHAAPAPQAAAVAPAAEPEPAGGVSVWETVLEVVAERTGYPADMLEADLDLEADLSVDSIKRVEIAGELGARLGLDAEGADLERLSAARTIESISALLSEAVGGSAVPGPQAAVTPATKPGPAGGVSVWETVLEVVAERTGYPADMLEADLDLEADLSVDSIKRVEIAGELGARLGLDAEGADLERLSAARTIESISALLDEAVGNTPGGAGTEPAQPEPAAEARPDDEPQPQIVAPERLLFTEHALPPARPEATVAGRVVLLDAGAESAAGADGAASAADALAARLEAAGTTVERLTLGTAPAGRVGAGDSVVYLGGIAPAAPALPDVFPLFQEILAAGPRQLLAVDRRTEGPLSGLRGFFRTVAREYPDCRAALVEVPQDASAEQVARTLVGELTAEQSAPVVLADEEGRRELRLELSSLGALAMTGAGPAGDGAAEAEAAGLDHESVVLLVGGARGITARFARTLAAASRCRLVLLGRTPEPADEEDPVTAQAADPAALRAVLLRSGLTKTPAETERRVSALLAEREVRATLRELTSLGSEARYHRVDVLDAEAVNAAVKETHARYGRLDGLVYAAGVIEDKLIAEKTADSFGRVFSTKVDGARTVLEAVERLPQSPRFAVLFGSIAAALGNRGQSDYASANDALEELGRRWSTPERRGLTVHWGPWAASETGGGMVSPALMRSYAARGIKLIDLDEGPLSLLRELAYGAPEHHAVVYTASGW
ncbi:SDR family NAD(P)-dependent oxidoreductase [Streptomyces sp. NPDC005438]|uniref:SDR family NAD(P)-dependent oxidoreductase n=1 Tax=Streptomyces sp. NPDC005438 TaxID=3156880 RepID=UPI0033A7CBDA